MSFAYDLITTNLNSTIDNKKAFFLGSWCLNCELENKIDPKKILEYHWNDKRKLVKDYEYLSRLHRKLLNDIYIKLNEHLKSDYKEIFWKIYLGPWLMYYIQTLYDRWETINNFINKYGNNFKTAKFNYNENDFTNITLDEFIHSLYSDEYNHIIYNKIILYILNNENNFYDYELKINPKKKQTNNNSFKSIFINFLTKILSPITSRQKILIFDTYMSKIDEINLNFKLKQFPTIFLPKLNLSTKNVNNYNEKLRKKTFKFKFKNKNFENFLLENLYFFLPTQFFENFYFIKKQSKKIYFPKKPKIIFTSHGLSNYTLSKFYVAEKVNECSKLIHGQHGGVYGSDLFTSHEEYERSVSDLYLTWGWKENEKTHPVGILKPIKKIKRDASYDNSKNSSLLYVLRSRSRYSVNLLHSDIRSSQMTKYFDENINLISKFDKNIKKNLILRLHSRKFGWEEKQRFKSKFNEINIDEGYQNIFNLINKSKLALFTYNATGYLETLSANVPTIIYFDIKQNPIRANSLIFFEKLKRAKIFFDDISYASIHVNKIWENIDSWWKDELTQKARIQFCQNFAMENENKIQFIKKTLDEIK
ncbi:LIC12162 family transferase [Candidatus Pelagibacter sp.]|uniref:LIC12162 family transferase n=1 Tax=Candidatus Pelagibacter sp. TaxID=2024849 RepID=UPI003F83B657